MTCIFCLPKGGSVYGYPGFSATVPQVFEGQNDLSFRMQVVRQGEVTATLEERNCTGPGDETGARTHPKTRSKESQQEQGQDLRGRKTLISLRNEKIFRGVWSVGNNMEGTRLCQQGEGFMS